jgi:hypothetical protein
MRSAALALVLGCVSPLGLSGQTVGDFQGAWDLVRTESRSDSGEWVSTTEPFGPGARGIIMYDGVGSMSVYIVRRGSAASRGDLAYYGRYEVDVARRIVTHKREHATSGDVSVDAVRGFEFDGDLLKLTVEPARQLRVVWRKRP